ncbi:hypothetical protein FVE85_5273 [Porphyridium purpureum]|uniref:Glycosyltransferase family 92 protein n=1 Tax=Porphyridium purpureum TaxID=35688 RepID=A0A5J4Z367_PORPP|nr:hypothetical protein FVE85_5273 [Porphyridium purpureum]|eukprot:POR9146..scf295_1
MLRQQHRFRAKTRAPVAPSAFAKGLAMIGAGSGRTAWVLILVLMVFALLGIVISVTVFQDDELKKRSQNLQHKFLEGPWSVYLGKMVTGTATSHISRENLTAPISDAAEEIAESLLVGEATQAPTAPTQAPAAVPASAQTPLLLETIAPHKPGLWSKAYPIPLKMERDRSAFGILMYRHESWAKQVDKKRLSCQIGPEFRIASMDAMFIDAGITANYEYSSMGAICIFNTTEIRSLGPVTETTIRFQDHEERVSLRVEPYRPKGRAQCISTFYLNPTNVPWNRSDEWTGRVNYMRVLSESGEDAEAKFMTVLERYLYHYVEFYVHTHKMSHVYLYASSQEAAAVAQRVAARPELAGKFFPIYIDPSMPKSFYHYQRFAMMECWFRSMQNHPDWILHNDLDEILSIPRRDVSWNTLAQGRSALNFANEDVSMNRENLTFTYLNPDFVAGVAKSWHKGIFELPADLDLRSSYACRPGSDGRRKYAHRGELFDGGHTPFHVHNLRKLDLQTPSGGMDTEGQQRKEALSKDLNPMSSGFFQKHVKNLFLHLASDFLSDSGNDLKRAFFQDGHGLKELLHDRIAFDETLFCPVET